MAADLRERGVGQGAVFGVAVADGSAASGGGAFAASGGERGDEQREEGEEREEQGEHGGRALGAKGGS